MTSSENQVFNEKKDASATIDNGDSDDDAFTFQKRSFQRKGLAPALETPVHRGRKRRKPAARSVDNWAVINQKSREKLRKVVKLALESDSDCSDADVEVVGSTKKALLQSPTPPPDITILDDSSDDDDDCVMLPASKMPVDSLQRCGASKEACETLLKARTAKLELERAQNYHAEDVYVPITISDISSPGMSTFSMGSTITGLQPGLALDGKGFGSQMPMQPSRPPSSGNATNLGPSLELTLRSIHIENGKKSAPTTEKQTIRRNEQFAALQTRFLASKHIEPSTVQVVMKFDGQTISMTKTPACYDMEDDDMVDCEIRTTSPVATAAASQTHPTTAKAGGRSCRLKLVTSAGKGQRHQQQPTAETFTVRRLNNVQALVDQYRAAHNLPTEATVTLKFDGEPMNASRTLESYDLDDDDQIDVIVK